MSCRPLPRAKPWWRTLLAGTATVALAASPVPIRADDGPNEDDVSFEQLSARYRDEPSAEEVIRRALRTARLDPGRAQDLRTRARLRGLIPTVRAGFRRGTGQDLSAYQTVDSGRTTTSLDDELSVQVWATFAFDRLMFTPEETALWREERTARAGEREIVRTVTALYFERRRLQIERDALGKRDPTHGARIAELTTLLDAFTDGAFLRIMRPR